MKILPDLNKILSLGVSLVFLSTAANLSAATWGGGNADWVSDNWGLNTPDGSPGDVNYPSEGATLTTAGTLLIKSGDSINMSGAIFMSVSTVNQTGGSLSNSTTTRNRSLYTLGGGSLMLTGAAYVENGGNYTINSGTFNATSAIFFGPANGSVNISGGVTTITQIRMDNDATSNAQLQVTGSAITTLQSTILVLANKGASATSNMNFVFDASGVKTWNIVGGPGSLTLGTGVTAANLSVNVSAMLSDGVVGVNLFDYGNASSVSGAFGTVTITDTTYGTLALGTEGALNPGEYFLDYGDAGDTDVTLFYNTIPEPGTLALVGLGLLILPFRRRYQRKS